MNRLNQYCLTVLSILGLLGLGGGCSLLSPQLTPVNREAHRLPPSHFAAPEPTSAGSLYGGETRRSLLFVDRKARLVNDLVTILVVESASASGEASTETGRDSSISGSLDQIFGINVDTNTTASLAQSFDGSGGTSRRNSLNATISAVVREVFPNGNLYIEGKKEIIINNERQYIILSGVIRPEDILTDNSIRSDLIADARIEYSGKGVLGDKQRPGWVGRILDYVWPF